MALLSTETAKPSTPKISRLRNARPLLRQAGSAVLNVCGHLQGRDLVAACRLVDTADLLIQRFQKLERMAQ